MQFCRKIALNLCTKISKHTQQCRAAIAIDKSGDDDDNANDNETEKNLRHTLTDWRQSDSKITHSAHACKHVNGHRPTKFQLKPMKCTNEMRTTYGFLLGLVQKLTEIFRNGRPHVKIMRRTYTYCMECERNSVKNWKALTGHTVPNAAAVLLWPSIYVKGRDNDICSHVMNRFWSYRPVFVYFFLNFM